MTDPSAQLLQPALVGEEDTLAGYPYRIHQLTGGTPLPRFSSHDARFSGLTTGAALLRGSLAARSALRGGAAARPQLTGSLPPNSSPRR